MLLRSTKKTVLIISHNSIEVIYSKRGQIEDFVISEGITTIRGWMSSDCSLTSIAFPNSITTIEECAFCGCPFASIVIPNNTMISGNAFSCCSSLTTATLHEKFEKQKGGIFVVVTSGKHTLGQNKTSFIHKINLFWNSHQRNDMNGLWN